MSENRFKAYLLSRQWSGTLSDFVDDAVLDANLPDAKLRWSHIVGQFGGEVKVYSSV